ncbi:zinc finger protein 277-like isoform X1 [Dermacentor silvarum]|uniref:zinc finger protein 277-like isoform X1 n=2 Tax=Dermacentor silvarum TaxID=543639 RepID=UPI00189BB563|nr:zinc finger protein 277-like isoform X1 [Dermacentor silvarum]XP_049528256.1 zinc finger protein 277-like isoform X1 [Dermacentor silvarum]XP_049528257.1 zinc finger protein 277-like isoform X1 [Dermacentor silvarum]XP_049528258.1 zinc finger protein 277-like isoform X1 [Dermacentor silvarum]
MASLLMAATAMATASASAAPIEPLFLPARNRGKKDQETTEVACIFCDIVFLVDKTSNFQNLLTHLLNAHKFVITDFTGVADPQGYFAYWKERFREIADIREVCVAVKTNSGENDVGTSEFYFLLSDKLPEDDAIRRKLRKSKLDDVLASQELERSDTSFKRTCLFCKQIFTENRAALLNHMAHDHNFSVGRPDNLVYVEEFLDVLEDKLNKLLCLYCEKTFKDWQTLKEHMRKKQHKKINPRNRAYDKYYVINYTEHGGLELPDQDEDVEPVNDKPDEFEDWEDESEETSLICLMCSEAYASIPTITRHMKDIHKFDFTKMRESLGFYQQVKVINYLRKQVYLNSCFVCSEKFRCHYQLLSHLSSNVHDNNVINKSCWDQPQFYFPTYENDQLLCALEDENLLEDSADEVIVPEDCVPPDSCVLEALESKD